MRRNIGVGNRRVRTRRAGQRRKPVAGGFGTYSQRRRRFGIYAELVKRKGDRAKSSAYPERKFVKLYVEIHGESLFLTPLILFVMRFLPAFFIAALLAVNSL